MEGTRVAARASVAACVAVLFLAPSVQAQETVVFSPDAELAPPDGIMSAYVNDLAVAGAEVRLTWIGRTTYGYRWGFSASHDGGRTFVSSPPPGSYGAFSLAVRVAALPDGRFAYAWNDAGVGVLVGIEESDGSFRVSDFLGSNSTRSFDVAADDTGVYAAWIALGAGTTQVMVGEFDPDDVRVVRTAAIDVPTGDASQVRLSVREGILGLVWVDIDWYNGTTTVMFSHAGTDLNASAPVSVSGVSSAHEGFPTIAMGPGGIAFVAFGETYAYSPVRAWTGLPPGYGFQPFADLATAIGASHIDELAAEFDPLGRLTLEWVDGLGDSPAATVQFTRASTLMSEFPSPTRLDQESARMKGGLAVGSNADGRAYAAWSTFSYGSDPDVHVAREYEPLPPPEPTPIWIVLGPLGVGVAGSASLVFLLRRRSRHRPRLE